MSQQLEATSIPDPKSNEVNEQDLTEDTTQIKSEVIEEGEDVNSDEDYKIEKELKDETGLSGIKLIKSLNCPP